MSVLSSGWKGQEVLQAKVREPKGAGQQSGVYELGQDEERSEERASRWDLVRVLCALERCLQNSGTLKSWTFKKWLSHTVPNTWELGSLRETFHTAWHIFALPPFPGRECSRKAFTRH